MEDLTGAIKALDGLVFKDFDESIVDSLKLTELKLSNLKCSTETHIARLRIEFRPLLDQIKRIKIEGTKLISLVVALEKYFRDFETHYNQVLPGSEDNCDRIAISRYFDSATMDLYVRYLKWSEESKAESVKLDYNPGYEAIMNSLRHTKSRFYPDFEERMKG